MAEKNLTNINYSNLPDAPSLVTLSSFDEHSPYHTGYETKEQYYMALAQIRGMAIAFVSDVEKPGCKFNFKKDSLSHLDAVIETLKGKKMDPKNLEIYIAEAGSYLGAVLEGSTHNMQGKWYPCYKQYWFSSYRFGKDVFSADSEHKKAIVETYPYAQVTKRIVSLVTQNDDGSPSMVDYYNLLMSDNVLPA